MTQAIYNKLAKYYLFISLIGLYGRDGHLVEARALKRMINKHRKSKGNEMLIVASGLGLHDKFLKKDYKITGIDSNDGMLRISKSINPSIKYKKADMRVFRLAKKFDIVMCLDAMAHLQTYGNFEVALRNFSRHLKNGGVLIFSLDPVKGWFREFEIKTYSKGKKEVTLIHTNHLRRKGDVKFDSCIVFVVKEKGKKMKIYLDESPMGLFEVGKIKRILSKMGFRFVVYESFTGRKYGKENPVFICWK